MRALLVRLHRWFGLAAALFLFIAGATGAMISWDHELDEWLNPQLFDACSAGTSLPVPALVARVEAADPRVRVSFTPLAIEPGHALVVSVQPRIDARTGRPFDPGYNQVAVAPATGAIQGRRQWGAGDVFMQAMFPLHSGRILGLPGRVLMSLMGVAIAALSVTGVLIWARKQRARTRLSAIAAT